MPRLCGWKHNKYREDDLHELRCRTVLGHEYNLFCLRSRILLGIECDIMHGQHLHMFEWHGD